MADNTLDLRDLLLGFVTPGTVADHIAKSYQRHLFGGATLQDLPANRRGSLLG
jgi:NTE family protein